MKKVLLFGLVVALLLSSVALGERFKVQRLPAKATLEGKVEYVPGEVLVKFREGVSKGDIADLSSKFGAAVLSVHRGGVRRLSVPAGKTEEEFISLLRRDPRVEYAELNTKCHAFMTPNDPYYSYQWHFPKINCPQAWDISTGTGVVVGVLDAGIAYEDYPVPSYESNTVKSGVTSYKQAPDLAGTNFTAGYDFINNDTHPNDNNGHGTHVAGTIAQTTNDSYGVAGMAFGCTLMPVKVLDYTGSGTASSLADGLYWATDHGAQVINMSLGWYPGIDPGATVHDAIQYAYNHGVVLVASSGNWGTGTISYPAKYSEVIAVGATRYDDQLVSYSQYGAEQEVVAPGGDMDVDQNGDGYGDGVLQQTFDAYDPGPPEVLADPTSFGWWFYEGTSMAAPHVTALVAMMIANGQTGVENIRNILHQTAVDLGASGWDQYYGYGRIDAYGALTYGGAPPVADFSGSPTSGCAPLTVNFTDQSTNDPTSWSWDFGDGGTSTEQNPSHTYTTAGTYTVSLTATNSYGSDTETKTDYITVSDVPTAAFTGSPTSGEVPLTVNFTDQSTGNPTSWSWDFGDGGTSTEQNPSHTYTTAGTYTVSLTASNSCGSDTETKADYITVTEAPGFCDDFNDGDASDWTVVAGTWTVVDGQYDGTNTSDYGYSLAPVTDMGEGTITVDWTSLTGGSWTNGQVLFGWTDANNYRCVDMRDGANKWYIREFIGGTRYNRAYTSETINTNQQYHLEVDIAADGKVTLLVDGTEKISYDFGDVVTGKVGLGVQKAHSQFDNFCATAQQAPPPPVADFSGSPTSGDAPLTVDFTDESTGEITSWDWDFGDGTAHSSEQNPTHTYENPGYYTVSLTVTGPGGSDTETKTDYIHVTGAVSAIGEVGSFTHNQADGDTWYTVNLNHTYTSPVVIAKSLSTNGGDPSHLRVRNVTSSSFEWQIEEWEYLDGAHTTETISYIVVEAGRHQLEDGTIIEAGTQSVATSWSTVSFSQSFSSVPALLVAVNTDNDATAIVPRTRNLGTGSFQVKVQEEEGQDGTHGTESVAWLAIEKGTGSNSGLNFEAGQTSNSVTHNWYTINLNGFTSPPIFLCHDDTYDGGNTCAARWRNLTSSSVEVKIEEEKSKDSEINHTTEAVSYLAWAEAGDILPQGGSLSFNDRGDNLLGLGERTEQAPEQFELSQNYPNPFNPTTSISFELPQGSWVRLEVYNPTGQKVAILVDGWMDGGPHTVNFDGSKLSSGVYLCRLQVGGRVALRKMVLLK